MTLQYCSKQRSFSDFCLFKIYDQIVNIRGLHSQFISQPIIQQFFGEWYCLFVKCIYVERVLKNCLLYCTKHCLAFCSLGSKVDQSMHFWSRALEPLPFILKYFNMHLSCAFSVQLIRFNHYCRNSLPTLSKIVIASYSKIRKWNTNTSCV